MTALYKRQSFIADVCCMIFQRLITNKIQMTAAKIKASWQAKHSQLTLARINYLK